MADWPPELPDLQLLGLTRQRQDGRLRSQMDAGPPKMRRRFTAVAKRYQIPVIFNGAQLQIFEDFYEDVLFEGSLPFTWEDPVTDAPVSFTFVEPPVWTMKLGGVPATRLYTGTLSLERLP